MQLFFFFTLLVISCSYGGSPGLLENGRDPRQLFSLLKSFLKPQQSHHELQDQYNQQASFYPAVAEQKISYQQQYPMLNYPSQQHSSVPFYNDNLQQQTNPELTPANPLLTILSSALGSGGSNNLKVSSMLSKLGLGLPEDLDLAGLINFGSLEGMLSRVNTFDKLKCIPRMICATVARRNEDSKLRDSTSTTTTERATTTTTKKPKNKKKSRQESGRFIKINGADSALDQFVKFLEMMQLKDWSIYPYVKGMHEGNQVTRAAECAHKFESCPFSEDQLVYYFNNYNGGFFQSFRSI